MYPAYGYSVDISVNIVNTIYEINIPTSGKPRWFMVVVIFLTSSKNDNISIAYEFTVGLCYRGGLIKSCSIFTPSLP